MDEFEHEYEDLFERPRCTDRYNARNLPYLHSKESCPWHGPVRTYVGGGDYYTGMPGEHPWKKWWLAREQYAETGEAADLKEMLSYVTETVPPMAPARAQKPVKVKRSRPSDTQVILIAIAAVWFVFALLAILI